MEKYTLEKAIECAKAEAHKKQKANKLFKAFDHSPESEDFTNGDPETIYTISLLYAQFVEDATFNEALRAIESALTKEFPTYH
ncbi:MAG TPA: hypothetical protein VK172_10540 [Lentimicrobium sp.]|nr:hypothetical protein [Lentimicrobium sp.]